ncbi:MAG: hypothetical protein ACTHOJ_01895 [Sphingomonas oligoaromativorans]
MTLTQAQLNAMPRVTPTGLAEQRYEASRAREYPNGPAGVPVPPAGAAFRMTIDGPLLDKIGRTALGAHERETVTELDQAATVDVLIEDIRRRLPPADMAVLERYGFASVATMLFINLPDGQTSRLPLAAAMMLTREGNRFTTIIGAPGAIAPIPEATRPFFDKVIAVEAQRTRLRRIASWPVGFKNRVGRPPRWDEIEAEWPVVGKWLAAQRAQMTAPA